MRHVALLACFLAAGSTAFAADARPAMSAKQAIEIAEGSLATRGLQDKIFVAGVTYERATLLKSKSYWFVKWSQSIPASDPKNREIGVKVNMDGSATRLVKEPGA